MKTVINVILGVCAVALAWICVRSIKDDQAGEDQVANREDVVKARLIDIKKAQEAYKAQHDTTLTYMDEEAQEMKEATFGAYAEDFDTLIEFLKTGRSPQVVKTALLCEELQREGWTEKKVANLIYETENTPGMTKEQAKKIVHDKLASEIRRAAAFSSMSQDDFDKMLATNQWADFRVDTIWTPLIETLYGDPNYPVDSLRYIPFAKDQERTILRFGKEDSVVVDQENFQLEAQVHFKMGIPMNYVMQCYAPYKSFLHTGGEDKAMDNRCINLIRLRTEQGKDAGLKIGSIDQWNNNAGNWE